MTTTVTTTVTTTPAAGPPHDARPRALPLVFDVLLVVLVVQAHLFALLPLTASWDDVGSPATAVVPWLVSLTVPLVALALARRRGGTLPTPAFAACAGVLLLVDVAAAVGDPSGVASGWQWGAIGVTALALASLRPARDVLLLAAAHTAVGLAAALLAGEDDAVALLGLVSATATPALVAAQYLRLHLAAVRARVEAVADRRELEVRAAAAAAVREDRTARLAALQADVLPLLAGVADGSVGADDGAVAARARLLGDDLRRELVEARSGRWLLPVDRAGRWPGLLVLDPTDVLRALDVPTRAALLAVVEALRGHDGWDDVVLATAEGAGEDDGAPGGAAVTVLARGVPVARAAADPALRAAAARLGGRAGAEDGALVVDARPTVRADRLPAWATGTA